MKPEILKTGLIVLMSSLLSALFVLSPEGVDAAIWCCADSSCFTMGSCSQGVLDFGTIDPSTTGSKTATVTTNQYFQCDGNKQWNASVTSSSWTLTGPTGGSIAYSVSYNTNSSCNGRTETLLTNTSTILQAAYQDAPAGSYTNSAVVTFTITGGGSTIYPTLTVATDVKVVISDVCTSLASGTLAFTIDPSGTGSIMPATTDSGNTSPTIKCTKNSTHAVTCTPTHGNLSIGNDGSTDPIPYTISTCGSSGSITGNGFASSATSIPVGLTITQANYQNAQAGTHTDTIAVTVTY